MIETKQLSKFRERINRISNESIISSCLNKTSKEYRSYDPGWYLYRKLNQKRKEIEIFGGEYLELIYVTLSAWNMNTRAAKLADFEIFKKILIENKELILSLKNYRIQNLSEDDLNQVIATIEKLFSNLHGLCIQNSKVVTLSKCLHFLLPDLIVPVDRKYTLSFFGYSYNIPKELSKQFGLYKNLFLCFAELSQKFDLSKYMQKRWNENIPKVIDNIIIGCEKLK